MNIKIVQALYKGIYRMILPLIKLYCFIKGKKESLEKHGFSLHEKPKNKKVIWFHGASVGESLCGMAMLKVVAKKYPDAFFVFTTCTEMSGQILREKLPKNAYYQPVPWDYAPYVQRFLNHWKPSIAFFIEADYWPNLILKTADQKIPLVLLNGRISQRSFKRWKIFSSLFKKMISSFSYIFPQTQEDLKRFQQFGGHDIKYVGNLKYSSSPLAYDSTQLKILETAIKDRPFWCAASTREGEETAAMNTHIALQKTFKNILTIVIPRHPHRAEKVVNDFEATGLKVARRSKNDPIQKDTDIYIADTIGEMGLFYALSPIVFVGGSLVPIGGHNPLEPAHLKCAILAGPHTFNNKQIFQELKENNAIKTIHNAEEMTKVVNRLLKNDVERNTLTKNAYTLVTEHTKTVDKILKELTPLLKKVLR